MRVNGEGEVGVGAGVVAVEPGAAGGGPPAGQVQVGVGGEVDDGGGDADVVAQGQPVGDGEDALAAIAQRGDVEAFFGGEDAGPDRPEQVMQRSGAGRAVGLEAVQDAEAVQQLQALLGGAQRGEPEPGQVVGGEHGVLVQHPDDPPVARGDPPRRRGGGRHLPSPVALRVPAGRSGAAGRVRSRRCPRPGRRSRPEVGASALAGGWGGLTARMTSSCASRCSGSPARRCLVM